MRRIGTFAVVVLLAGVLTGPPALAGTLSASPPSGPAGTFVTVSGSGFALLGTCTLHLLSGGSPGPTNLVGQCAASPASGLLTGDFVVPNWTPNKYTLLACNAKEKVYTCSETGDTSFIIDPPPTTTTTTTTTTTVPKTTTTTTTPKSTSVPTTTATTTTVPKTTTTTTTTTLPETTDSSPATTDSSLPSSTDSSLPETTDSTAVVTADSSPSGGSLPSPGDGLPPWALWGGGALLGWGALRLGMRRWGGGGTGPVHPPEPGHGVFEGPATDVNLKWDNPKAPSSSTEVFPKLELGPDALGEAHPPPDDNLPSPGTVEHPPPDDSLPSPG